MCVNLAVDSSFKKQNVVSQHQGCSQCCPLLHCSLVGIFIFSLAVSEAHTRGRFHPDRLGYMPWFIPKMVLLLCPVAQGAKTKQFPSGQGEGKSPRLCAGAKELGGSTGCSCSDSGATGLSLYEKATEVKMPWWLLQLETALGYVLAVSMWLIGGIAWTPFLFLSESWESCLARWEEPACKAGCAPVGELRMVPLLSCFWSRPALWRLLKVDCLQGINDPTDCKISMKTGGGKNRKMRENDLCLTSS